MFCFAFLLTTQWYFHTLHLRVLSSKYVKCRFWTLFLGLVYWEANLSSQMKQKKLFISVMELFALFLFCSRCYAVWYYFCCMYVRCAWIPSWVLVLAAYKHTRRRHTVNVTVAYHTCVDENEKNGIGFIMVVVSRLAIHAFRYGTCISGPTEHVWW